MVTVKICMYSIKIKIESTADRRTDMLCYFTGLILKPDMFLPVDQVAEHST